LNFKGTIQFARQRKKKESSVTAVVEELRRVKQRSTKLQNKMFRKHFLLFLEQQQKSGVFQPSVPNPYFSH